jgi:hypothetical protein
VVSAKIPFANTTEFYAAFGRFHAAWSRTELVIDCAIWKAGTESANDVHKLVASMQFSEKCKHFRSLLPTSNKFENLQKIEELLDRIIIDAKRNELAHSFLASDEKCVTFILRRTRKGKYEAKQATLTPEQFVEHVDQLCELSLDFQRAVGLLDEQVALFGAQV